MTAPRFRATALGLALAAPLAAQAPVLQDGAAALRQERRSWLVGEPPLTPLAIPSLEVGLGGADAGGPYTPLLGGEGLGQGLQGWGLGLQGRYVREGWSVALTAAGLGHADGIRGRLLRGALAYQGDSGWRLALEQGPLTWGTGLAGGGLPGDTAPSFPRLSVRTSELESPLGRWRAEAFLGRLERDRPIPAWMPDRDARLAAQAAGLDLHRARLSGAFLRGAFGSWAELGVGAVRMHGGEDDLGRPAPADSERTAALAELWVRVPALASLAGARGAAVHVARRAAPDSPAVTLSRGGTLAALQLAWEGWDLGLEYAGAASRTPEGPFSGPAYLAGWSTDGDPLGPGFGSGAITRTVALGLPLFLEGQGQLRMVRTSAGAADPVGAGSWFLQGEAQWRTPTGRIGGSVASRRMEFPAGPPRWGWSLAVFQAFRVF